MKRTLILVLAAAMLLLAVAGCEENPVLPDPNQGEPPDSDRGTIDVTYADFSLKVATAVSPGGVLPGPFLLQGKNLRYLAEEGVLAVDFTITNTSQVAHPEPVQITFVDFIPATVTVANPPVGGMPFTFGFVNDDAVWTPGEESFPLTVKFRVPEGVSFGFGVIVTVGYGAESGVISGRLFSDQDNDGVMDEWEPGWPDREVYLEGDPEYFAKEEIVRIVTVSGPDGEFSFAGLEPGYYVVGLDLDEIVGIGCTTRNPLHVVLVGEGGYFADANFGLRMLTSPYFEYSADADATVRGDLAVRENDNYGADPFLIVGGTRVIGGPADAMRSLIHFSLTNSWAYGLVASARLELTIADFWAGEDEIYRIDVYPVVPSGVRTPWIEGNGCETLPLLPGTEWVDPAFGVAWTGAADGGDANNQTCPDIWNLPVASAEVVQGRHAPGDVISFDITRLVNAWISGRIPNLGIMIRDGNVEAGEFRQLMFGARDGLLRGHPDPRVQPGPLLAIGMVETDRE